MTIKEVWVNNKIKMQNEKNNLLTNLWTTFLNIYTFLRLEVGPTSTLSMSKLSTKTLESSNKGARRSSELAIPQRTEARLTEVISGELDCVKFSGDQQIFFLDNALGFEI